MIWALFVKEFRQHAALLAALFGSGVILLGLLLLAFLEEAGGGVPYTPLRFYVLWIAFVIAPILCSKLISLEYRKKTQLFLEGLPVSRSALLIQKYLIGVVFLMAATALGFAISIWVSSNLLTASHLRILAIRSLATILPWYSVFFAASFTGRYRYAFNTFLIGSLIALDLLTSFSWNEFGPTLMLTDQLGLEDTPAEALRVSAVITVAPVLLALALGTLREGSVAGLLGEKMSRRERLLFVTAGLALLSGFTIYDERKPRDPYELIGAITAEREQVTVQIARGDPEDDPLKQALADRIADELVRVAEYLGISALPPIFLINRVDLDPDLFENGHLTENEGTLVRSNLHSPGLDETALLEYLIHESISEHSMGRALREPRHWILDGFLPFWWLASDNERFSAARRQQLSLRVLYALPLGAEADDLNAWFTLSERVGPRLAEAIGFSALATLLGDAGPESTRTFLRAALSARGSDDVRGLWDDYRIDWEELLESTIGLASNTWIRSWSEELERSRALLGGELLRVPRLAADFHTDAASGTWTEVGFSARVTPEADASTRLIFAYQELSWADTPLLPEYEILIMGSYADMRSRAVPGEFARGDRIAGVLRMHSEILGCEITSGWSRMTVP